MYMLCMLLYMYIYMYNSSGYTCTCICIYRMAEMMKEERGTKKEEEGRVKGRGRGNTEKRED